MFIIQVFQEAEADREMKETQAKCRLGRPSSSYLMIPNGGATTSACLGSCPGYASVTSLSACCVVDLYILL
jgi:hypothetical protein